MSPTKQHYQLAQAGKSKTKGRGSAKAIRQARARRRIEELREEQFLRDSIHDVFLDE